ncbi:NAD(P)-dependent alcohol dehydrogenase [Solicola gregarius]|uniref:NAD(P)-dependent alcohol dehydrogenase n=1 Tax=Solicola gregarius TaxID=2908642 RepID=A0AA46TIA0_9ACTN|nr:NAD(P)-dependent alcohol dehydrogenase [Solicola gregarius]UYM05018.1 NAD(P)-dependent alcohol dehydrogenase [Solicola gregarius]
MRAIVQDDYGSPDVLELRDIAVPTIVDDEVLVRVHAAGVDRGVWHLVTGMPYPIRLAGYGLRSPKRAVPGTDLAGVVEVVGSAVTRFRPGAEVFGIGIGSFAQYARAAEASLVTVPRDLTFEQAAATSVSGIAALQGLRDHAHVESGQRVLVIGASGGVGTFAVQLGKALGAEVTGVCSAAKVELVRSLGADDVIAYEVEDFADRRDGFDAILDIGGNATLTRLRRALRPKGTLVIAGGETGGRWLGGTDRQLRAMLLSRFVGQTLTTFVSRENGADITALAEFIESGAVRPAIDRTFPLELASDALRYVEQGRARGKVVLNVRASPSA